MTNFAFYGRVSTEDQQDPESSRNWQLDRSRQLIEPAGGIVVAEFFDIGQSRSLPWKRRPEAARLLAAIADPERGFDAVVIGEPQRAFYGNQFSLTYPLFDHHHVALWVPEVGGAIDVDSEAHDLVMNLFGGMSKGERSRIKTRVRSAMGSQARHEGRFLGGRPPYGYQLADAGPHPNPGKAADGKRLHRLEVDPITAPVVRRIFDEYLQGKGQYAIAEGLTRDGIPSPSGNDPERNPHRQGSHGAWGKSAVRAILANPRYTGFEVWNKQRRDEELIDLDDVAQGHSTKMRWNDPTKWIWSETPAHQPIIERDAFEHVHHVVRPERTQQGSRRPRSDARNSYMLRGLLTCGLCGRRMQGNTVRGRKLYRCRYAAEYALTADHDHPKQLYVSEDPIVCALDAWISGLFDPEHLDETCQFLAAASAEPDPGEAARVAPARKTLATADRRLAKYRQALDHDADPAVISIWIAELNAEKADAQRVLAATKTSALSASAIRARLEDLGDVSGVLAEADVDERIALYTSLGLELVYAPGERRVDVTSAPIGVDIRACRRGDTYLDPTRSSDWRVPRDRVAAERSRGPHLLAPGGEPAVGAQLVGGSP